MILIVGLGNPGDEYKNTRHNVGFMLIDELLSNGEFDALGSSKFKGELYKKGSLLLLKPQTFMNLSGNSVKAVKDFYKPERIIVIHDDIDLKFGAMKFKFGGSSGGHNGIKSIDNLIGNEYERIRIGVGRSENSLPNSANSANSKNSANSPLSQISNLSNLNLPNFKPNTANFVLSNFNANEKECLKEILKYAKNGLLELIKSNINEISAKFNTKNCLKD
ncbi:MAG: aminoacyl-tRNA hydrolase [Campylobacter sp.]|nr:aminoacyl-tRNA hydrolase [Campylobacter sp.]